MPVLGRPRSRRGAALLISIAMLLVLAVLAVTFSRMMVPERDGARNFSLATQARMASHAGIETAIARLRSDVAAGKLDEIRADWRYMGEDADRDFETDPAEDTNLNGLVDREECPLGEAVAPSYQVSGKPYSGTLDRGGMPGSWTVRYRLKIRDAQGMVNLNENKALWWYYQHLGIGIRKHLGMTRDVIADMTWPNPAGGAPLTGTSALLTYRDQLPGKVFQDRTQLIPLLKYGERDLRILAPYVTVNNWLDPRTYTDTNGDWWWGTPYLAAYPTHPVNINTAPRPVLNAAISGACSWMKDRSTQAHWKTMGEGGTGYNYGARNHEGYRYRAYYPAGSSIEGNSWSSRYPEWSWRGIAWAWYWDWNETGFELFATPVHQRRIGREVDANGTGAAESSEDTSFVNGQLDSGMFRRSQDWCTFLATRSGKDDCWWESMRGGLPPEGYVNRFNGDWAPSLGFHEAGNVRQLFYDNYGIGDRSQTYRYGPAWCFRSHGYFEIESLGEVVDGDGKVVARHTTQVDARLYYPLIHSTQKDFLTKPASGASYKQGQTCPTTPWVEKDVTDYLKNTTTFPENVRDASDGSAKPETTKAEAFFGGVLLSPRDYEEETGLLLAADYQSTVNADYGAGGAASQVVGVGKNKVNGGGAATKVIENKTMGRQALSAASDLFPDGLYVDPIRARKCTYSNPEFKNMRPDKGSLEFWVKFDNFHYPGELITAFFPADPTVESISTEGIAFRVSLAFLPCTTTNFRGLLDWLLPRKTTHPYRHPHWGSRNLSDQMMVPCLVAERNFYTANTELSTAKIHGRDARYGDIGTTASYATGKYVFTAANFVDYDVYPLTNWAKPHLWHHVEVAWKDGTDVSMKIDGVGAPIQWSIPNSTPAKGDVFTTYWDWKDVAGEIHVGGISLPEVWNGARGYHADFKVSQTPATIRWPDPASNWTAGGYNNPYHWQSCATIDQLRIYSDPAHVADLDRFPGATPGTYQNVVQFPDDAVRLATMAWDELVPMFDPNNNRDSTYRQGVYIRPEDRPWIEMALRPDWGKSGTWLPYDTATLESTYGMTGAQAADAALSGGMKVDLPITKGEQFAYRATFRRNAITKLQVTPILESVTFFYMTKKVEVLRWEEAP